MPPDASASDKIRPLEWIEDGDATGVGSIFSRVGLQDAYFWYVYVLEGLNNSLVLDFHEFVKMRFESELD